MNLVNLSDAEVRWCVAPAVERWQLKSNSKDQPNYAVGKANGKLEHELLATIRANVSEYAVAKLTGRTWTFPIYPSDEHPRRKDLADVGHNIEVRTVRTQNAIPVWQKDVNKNAVIFATRVVDLDFFREVKVYGWRTALDCRNQEWWDETIGGWRVPLDKFTPYE